MPGNPLDISNPQPSDSSGGAQKPAVDPGGKSIVANNKGDILDTIVSKYKAVYVYKDDFSNGMLNGWREQFDSSSPGRVGLTLTDEARVGSYGLLMHSRPAAGDQAWARKGVVVPDGVKKVIKGCYFMFHGANENNPQTLNFDFDFQAGDGSNTGTHRHYWRLQYLNHDGTNLLQKWRMANGTATQADTNLVDVTGGAMPIGWNESEKPLLCYMVGVFNVETNRYEHLYANGLDIDLTGQDQGPAASTSLANYDKGAIDLYILANRSNASEDVQFIIEKPFLAYVM